MKKSQTLNILRAITVINSIQSNLQSMFVYMENSSVHKT